MFKLLAVSVLVAYITGVYGLGTVIVPGDLYIEFVDAIYSDDACTVIEPESVQNMQAAKWTIEELNSISYSGSVKIGLRVSATCSSVERATHFAVDLAAEMSTDNTTDIVGVLGSGYSSETEAISRLLSALPEQYRLLQIGYSSTSASLRNRKIFKNFFRTIPPDDIQVEVMRDFMRRLNWTYMTILYENSTYGIGGYRGLQDAVEGLDICFQHAIALRESDYNDKAYMDTLIGDTIFGRNKLDNSIDPPITGIIIFGSYVLAETVLDAVETLDTGGGIQEMPVFLFSEAAVYVEGKYANVSRGSYIVSPPKQTISNFQTYWTQNLKDKSRLYDTVADDKYLKQLYEQVFKCQLAGTVQDDTCPALTDTDITGALKPSLYNQYVIQATCSMAHAIKRLLIQTCNSATLCPDIKDSRITSRKDFFDALMDTEIKFDDAFGSFRQAEFRDPDLVISYGQTAEAQRDETNFAKYEVFNEQICQQDTCQVKIAEHLSGQLNIQTADIRDYERDGTVLEWPYIRKPQVTDGYVSEKCLAESVDDTILYTEGDMYIVGIVPVHNVGDTPLNCGPVKQGGLDIVEAIRFAVEDQQKDISDKIGVIIIDSCNDPQIIQEKILTLHRLGVFINGSYQPVGHNILGYVGGWSSDVSTAIAHLTTRLKTVQISYASTAPSLSRRLTFPYFLRIPSPDDDQAKAMLKIIRELGGNFIQVMYSETQYGEGGRDVVKYLAEQSEYNICVGNEIPVNKDTDANDVVRQLRSGSSAKFVVLFVGSFELYRIVDQLNTVLLKDEFLFIASEGWGTRLKLASYNNLVGTITVASKLTVDTKYTDHLQDIRPDGSNEDPWVRAYMESTFDCYYEWSYDKTSNQQCSGSERLGDANYDVEAWAPFALRAVKVMLMAAKTVLDKNCLLTKGICDSFNITEFIVELKKQELDGAVVPTKQPVFNDNGDGTAGYLIYAMATTGEYRYLGFSSSSEFSFQVFNYYDIRHSVTLNSTCGDEPVCAKCFPKPAATSKTSSLPTGAIVVIVLLGLICCTLAAVLLFICNRHGCCLRIEGGRPKFTATYLTPVYAEQRRRQGNPDGSDGRDFQKKSDENYDSINSYNMEFREFGDQPRSGDSSQGQRQFSNGSYDQRSQHASSQGSMSMAGAQNRAFDGSLDRQNSAFSGSQTSGFSAGQVPVSSNPAYQDSQSSGRGSYDGTGASGGGVPPIPQSHRFVKPPLPPPPANRPIVYQADGSYITAHTQASEQVPSIRTGDAPPQMESDTSDKSLGYLRSVHNNDDNNRI